jgi:hypothetical protein
VLESLRRIRVRVPDDISVVGYDDTREARYLNPPLTTVRVPKERVGEMLAERLFQCIAGAAAPALMLDTEMVIRESCTALRKRETRCSSRPGSTMREMAEPNPKDRIAAAYNAAAAHTTHPMLAHRDYFGRRTVERSH